MSGGSSRAKNDHIARRIVRTAGFVPLTRGQREQSVVIHCDASIVPQDDLPRISRYLGQLHMILLGDILPHTRGGTITLNFTSGTLEYEISLAAKPLQREELEAAIAELCRVAEKFCRFEGGLAPRASVLFTCPKARYRLVPLATTHC